MNRISGSVAGLFLLAFCRPSVAESFFLPATDAQLRADVELLVDESVMELPISAWPLSRADVAWSLARVRDDTLAAPALRAAISRVRSKLAPIDEGGWRVREVRSAAGRPSVLRSYDTLARDEFEVGAVGGASTERWNFTLNATLVGSPDDQRRVRFDGTELSLRWGNWIFSVNQMPRWWGPGWDGSLILSTNARPLPAASIDRDQSSPFDVPLLRWLGPWKFSAFLARAEKYRPDVDSSLLMGMRATFKPFQILEIGLSRTAQFCGRGRPCDFTTFKDVLLGNDNAGLRVAPEDEPGNQMAGIDVRVVSPWRSLPMTAYAQLIGEDNSSSGIPERYLAMFGLHSWWMSDTGDAVRWRVEYSNTSCKFYAARENADCAYRQGIFRSGYRFHGRNIGHTTDSDSQSLVLAATWTRPAGTEWGVHLRHASLDRFGWPDPWNPLTQGHGSQRSVQLSWRGRLIGQQISIQAGYERYSPGGRRSSAGPIGFVEWRKSL